jgi:Fe-S cluster biogenesis protein NfuA
MTERTDEQIIENIKEVLETYIAPAVASHGGEVNFVSYQNNKVLLELSGACSGCAGSTMTLKFGVENMLRELVPEVQEVEGMDDPFSNVDPFYTSFDFIEEDFYDPDN